MGTRTLRLSAFKIAAAILGLGASLAHAQVFEPMKLSCAVERDAYCGAVMPSDARLALCLYAHEDKLSAPCGVAVYDAMVALHVSLNTLSTYAKTCRSDLMKFCASERWGQGRLYNCLDENKEALALECRTALNGARPELQQLGIVK